MGVGAQIVADLAAEQAPDRHAERFAENVPEGHLDAADGGHAVDAQAPEAVAGQDLVALLDVARILADQQRLEVLDGADDRARLPFQRGLAPPDEPGHVRLDADEHPVAHFGIADDRADPRDTHDDSSLFVVFSCLIICCQSRAGVACCETGRAVPRQPSGLTATSGLSDLVGSRNRLTTCLNAMFGMRYRQMDRSEAGDAGHRPAGVMRAILAKGN